MKEVVAPGLASGTVEQLYRNDGARLWRALYAKSGDRTVADDAVAEAFAQLLRRGDDVRDPRAWVWRAAFRISAGMLSDRPEVGAMPSIASADEPEHPTELFAALQALSEQQRKALLLRDYVGFTTAETARILDSTPASIRVQLTRARRTMRKVLDP